MVGPFVRTQVALSAGSALELLSTCGSKQRTLDRSPGHGLAIAETELGMEDPNRRVELCRTEL